MKYHYSYLLIFIIFISSSFKYTISTEPDKDIKQNIEENDEFDDPSLLSDESPEEETPKKTKKKSKKESEKKNEDDDIYPSLEQLKEDKVEEMNKYKYFFMKHLY